MPTTDDLKMAIGCLSAVFPQYVAKELAGVTDQIAAALQGFTDPLAAMKDLHIDTLVNQVRTTSAGDAFTAMESVAVGLGTQYTQRQITDYVTAMSTEAPNVTKRIQQMRNLAGQVSTSVGLMLSLFPDMPYAAAQRMCILVIEAGQTKTKNLMCLKKHIVQLVNAILVLVKNGSQFKENSIIALTQAAASMTQANQLLSQSQKFLNGTDVFDKNVFARAREQIANASGLLTPPQGAQTVLDVTTLLPLGSVLPNGFSLADEQLIRLTLPALMLLIEQEVNAIVRQVQVIDFFVQQIANVVIDYRSAGSTKQVKQQRTRTIAKIRSTLTDLTAQVQLAAARGGVKAASGEMVSWSSRLKSILAMMDSVKSVALTEGSSESDAKARQLAAEYKRLIESLTGITNAVATNGIEDPLPMRAQVFAMTKGARRLLTDIENGRVDENHLANFHRLALVVATNQASKIEQSETVVSLQALACQRFADLDLAIGERFDDLLGSMRQLGLDRGVDMLNAGAFTEFLGQEDLQLLSYVGTAIDCLRHGIEGTDDEQTRRQLGRMRDDLIAKRSNLEIASADSADQGRTRLVTRLQADMASLQKNATMVESIVSDFRQALATAGEVVDGSLAGLQQFNAFLGNLDHLAVAAGGRLAGKLEEFSDHPNAGVVDCD